VLRGTLGSGAKPVALDFKFGVYATPQPILEAIPGALVLSPSPGVRLISKIVRLVAGPAIGKPLRVLSVTTSSPSLHATLRNWKILISLNMAPGQKLFQGDVDVAYVHNGIQSTLDIPVFAAPDLVGP
jgi:hypothetical protein